MASYGAKYQDRRGQTWPDRLVGEDGSSSSWQERKSLALASLRGECRGTDFDQCVNGLAWTWPGIVLSCAWNHLL